MNKKKRETENDNDSRTEQCKKSNVDKEDGVLVLFHSEDQVAGSHQILYAKR